MNANQADWPSEKWRLTAPESYVLRSPGTLSAGEALKLALRELVLRRALRMERSETGRVVGRRRTAVLRDGSARVSEPALTPVLELYRRTSPRHDLDGVLVDDLAKEARREFGRSLAGYVDDHVYPSLAQRGLIQTEEPRGFFRRRRRHRLTEAGREAATELEDWLWTGEQRLGDWVRQRPEHALAYTGGAGAAVLLVPSLYPELERLGRRTLEEEPASPGGDFGPLDFDAFSAGEGGLEGGGFDGLDSGFDAGGGGFGGFGDGGGSGGGEGGGS